MPRNGDGSGDNGPIEGHHIIHGASGDNSLQHAKNNVAPMPDIEKGEAIKGMNASGGGEAPKSGHTGQGRAASDSNKPAPVEQAKQ
ncbi:hypothetical protein ACEQ8H_001347 [Pleosporales sp. CAS-2024a]